MRYVSKEDGFTLVELLIVTVIVGMTGAAIFGVYQVSQSAYTTAISLEDAQLGARTGLEQMTAELRLIGASWSGATGAGPAITAATPTSITFQGDVDGVTTTLTQPASGNTLAVASAAGFLPGGLISISGGALAEIKTIRTVHTATNTITLTSSLVSDYPGPPSPAEVHTIETVTYARDGNGFLIRSVNGNTAADQIQLVGNVTTLTLNYFDGSNPPVQVTDLSAIREIQISLTVQGQGGSSRTMTSRVRPRNF